MLFIAQYRIFSTTHNAISVIRSSVRAAAAVLAMPVPPVPRRVDLTVIQHHLNLLRWKSGSGTPHTRLHTH